MNRITIVVTTKEDVRREKLEEILECAEVQFEDLNCHYTIESSIDGHKYPKTEQTGQPVEILMTLCSCIRCKH